MIENLSSDRWLAAGIAGILALISFIQAMGLPSFGSRDSDLNCNGTVRAQAVLTETQIAKLLSLKKGEAKDTVRSLLKDPYCTLPKSEIRAGAPADREAYLVQADDFVQFDPKTRLVILYEGDQYAGFRFWVR